MKHLLLTFLCVLFLVSIGLADINVIPKPAYSEVKQGEFIINSDTKIVYPAKNSELKRIAELLASGIKEQCGITVKTESLRKQKNNFISLSVDDLSIENDKAYTLNVTSQSVTICGKTAKAVFYAYQTLRQLLPANPSAAKSIRAVHIEDYPRFEWRGMHFDVCRHIYPLSYIKQLLDEMAYYKLDKFHWHLTDDQGWRIEIKKYPKLAEIAAWRNGTQYGPVRYVDVDNVRYGGYYTQEQIKEVVDYAKSLYIEVIPEIEMPGHSVAAITAYPHLACGEVSFETGKPFEVRKVWGVSKDLYCAGNDDVFTFLEDVLTEVMELFPSQYIHVGGDEAPHDAWKKCPKCQKRIKNEGLKDEMDLQNYFVRRIENFINAKGKRLIGWEEIMQGGLSPSAVAMSWLGTTSGVEVAKKGYSAIMCPFSHMYLDAYQADPDIEPLAIGYFTPLEKAYSFEPHDPALTEEEKPYILGVQGNLWTEFISNTDVLEYMLYPRICAVSEIAWSPKEAKNWDSFKARLINEMARLQNKGINFRIPTPEAPSSVFMKPEDKLEIKNTWGLGEIRYTTDGSEPTLKSPLYTQPITPVLKGMVRSAIFLPDGRRSSVCNTIVKEKSVGENFVK